MPLPGLMDLVTVISNPNGSPKAFKSDAAALPATLDSTSSGRSVPGPFTN